MLKRVNNKKGFTLVELLIVIAVLGILAGIGINSMSGVTTTFKEKADEKTAEMLARAVEIQFLAGGLGSSDTPATATTKIKAEIATAECKSVTSGTFAVTSLDTSTGAIKISVGTKGTDDGIISSGAKEIYSGKISVTKVE